MHSGRARSRFRKLLASLRLWRSRRSGRDERVFAAVAGSDPRVRHASYGTADGWDVHGNPTPAWVAPGPSVPCGKAIEPAFRGRVRNRHVGVNVMQGRMGRPVAWDHEGSSGESRGHGGRPPLRQTSGRRPAALPPRSGAERPSGTDLWRGSDPWKAGARVRKHARRYAAPSPRGGGSLPPRNLSPVRHRASGGGAARRCRACE